jgi:nucleoprotein TPR
MTAQIAALKAQHEKDLEIARDNIRKELETRSKMMQLQITKLRQENTALKAAQNQAGVPPATASPVVPTPAAPGVPSVPPTPTDAAAPPAVIAPPIPSPSMPGLGTTRGRGAGRGTPGQRGGPAGRGRGRGTILDSVNQAMQSNQPPTPGELSILGAGQKRQREDETGDPGSLAKRLKPGGEASLPAKPVPLNRNRPGAPGN